jgi:broad specificity phosphatase PhoE
MRHSTTSQLNTTVFGMLRHGETEWNRLKKIQGFRDSPLTAKGQEHLHNWVPTLKKYHWNRIFASDLGRVKETVAILNQELNLPVEYDARLREQNWGEWEGYTIPSIHQQFAKELKKRVKQGWLFSAPGGETRLEVKDRVLDALLDAHKKWQGQKILVVCHQGIIKTTLYHITGREFLPEEDPLLQHNRLHVIEYSTKSISTLELNIPQDIDSK